MKRTSLKRAANIAVTVDQVIMLVKAKIKPGKIVQCGTAMVKWLGLFGQVNRFYKWMTAGFTPQPGLVGAG